MASGVKRGIIFNESMDKYKKCRTMLIYLSVRHVHDNWSQKMCTHVFRT